MVLLLVPYNYPDIGRYTIEKYDDYGSAFFSAISSEGQQQHREYEDTTGTTSSAFRNNNNFNDQESIRKWGCDRMETPTIFVHLAKAGGGSNRARFAAAALGYNRTEWHSPDGDNHHYPVVSDAAYGQQQPETRHAKFCNSLNQHFVVPTRDVNGTLQTHKTFEGSLPCNASTPMGLAVGCPKQVLRQCLGCDLSGETCDTVYVGHNFLGSELHWLPPKYLKKWWHENWVPTTGSALTGLDHDIEETWKRLGGTTQDTVWCDEGYNVPVRRSMNQTEVCHGRPRHTLQILQRYEGDGSYYTQCSAPIAAQADGQFQDFWKNAGAPERTQDYSSIYASMPLHRTTVMREPWSWVGSKFFWHRYPDRGFTCDKDLHTWMYDLVHAYLMPFCGVDCSNRFSLGIMSYDEAAAQAASNLRQSFSVVGLLNETDRFYEMVSSRIGYLDMTRNPHVHGKKHKSAGADKDEEERCKALFNTPEFQEEAKQAVPEMKLVEQLFNIGVEVNRFQQEELSQCGR
ncbi:MAG: hypothetical protein SGILL_006284 [Bacillariaceae sp.]